MTTAIGAYEAKTRLPELLRAVVSGETFVITLRDRAVAQLVPIAQAGRDTQQAVQAMQEFMARPGRTLPTEDLDALRREDQH
jgi:antitoxin (DNA-binding transcriptional repressor) of toxin-antitoxin stability system